jgi:hypothetical protein
MGPLSSNFLLIEFRESKGQSIWWRYLKKIGGEGNDDWFRTNVSNVLGKRNEIVFCMINGLDLIV